VRQCLHQKVRRERIRIVGTEMAPPVLAYNLARVMNIMGMGMPQLDCGHQIAGARLVAGGCLRDYVGRLAATPKLAEAGQQQNFVRHSKTE
jgi:hypothetical protein